MYEFDASRPIIVSETNSARQWFVHRLGRYVLSVTGSGAVAVVVNGAAPVLLRMPRPDFEWPAEFVIDPFECAVTATDQDRPPGGPLAYRWSIPLRSVPTISIPIPSGSSIEELPGTRTASSLQSSPATGISPDGRYMAFYDRIVSSLVVEDLETARKVSTEELWRSWPTGGPWWSPDGQWLVTAWYTTKNFDHGRIAAVSRETLNKHFDNPISGELEWSVIGFPNGQPYPETVEMAGSYDPIDQVVFSEDPYSIFVVDRQSVVGIAFPEMVELFRLPRPDLTKICQTVSLDSSSRPYVKWRSGRTLVVATEDGNIGSVSQEFGLSLLSEKQLEGGIVAFDVVGDLAAAVDSLGGVMVWHHNEEPRRIAVIQLVEGERYVLKCIDQDSVYVGDSLGRVFLVCANERTYCVSPGMSDISQIILTKSGRGVIAVSSNGRAFTAVRVERNRLAQLEELTGDAIVAEFNEHGVVFVDGQDFVHVGEQKYHIGVDGSFGAPIAADVAVIFTDETFFSLQSAPVVTAVTSCRNERIAVATRFGTVSEFCPETKETSIVGLGGDVAHELCYSPDGQQIAAVGAYSVHLISRFAE